MKVSSFRIKPMDKASWLISSKELPTLELGKTISPTVMANRNSRQAQTTKVISNRGPRRGMAYTNGQIKTRMMASGKTMRLMVKGPLPGKMASTMWAHGKMTSRMVKA